MSLAVLHHESVSFAEKLSRNGLWKMIARSTMLVNYHVFSPSLLFSEFVEALHDIV